MSESHWFSAYWRLGNLDNLLAVEHVGDILGWCWQTFRNCTAKIVSFFFCQSIGSIIVVPFWSWPIDGNKRRWIQRFHWKIIITITPSSSNSGPFLFKSVPWHSKNLDLWCKKSFDLSQFGNLTSWINPWQPSAITRNRPSTCNSGLGSLQAKPASVDVGKTSVFFVVWCCMSI